MSPGVIKAWVRVRVKKPSFHNITYHQSALVAAVVFDSAYKEDLDALISWRLTVSMAHVSKVLNSWRAAISSASLGV